jgi:preprotein translocase subunit SecY
LRALKIIPLLVVLLFLVYLGVLFVEANQTEVTITLGSHKTQPTRLGFVVMTSVLIGIFAGAFLASAQVVLLFLQNRSLRKRVGRGAVVEIMQEPVDKTQRP